MQTGTTSGIDASAPTRSGTTASASVIGAAGLRRSLMARATFGHRREDRAELDALGQDAWLDLQLQPELIDDSSMDARLGAYPWLGVGAVQGMDSATLRQNYGGGGWRLSEESKSVRILRAKDSRRQLFERVVDFWNDHFNVPFTAQDANYLRPVHEERVIRRHAFGKFPEFLAAVAMSPAMGAFLDQDSNRAGLPNENYARELLELHTLGEGNGYTEEDVREVARCFTGWTYVRHWEPGAFGTFRFDSSVHDQGYKTVLGRLIPNGGQLDGVRVLRLLALDPRTARHVSSKLVRWFLGEDAAAGLVMVSGQSIVDRVTGVFLATDGDIRAMLREILSVESLRAVQPWRRRRLKQPFHFGMSFLRALEIEITNPSTAVYGLAGLGQVPFEWPDPDGYPDETDAWASNLAPRWRFASAILNGWTSWSSVPSGKLASFCQGVGPEAWGRCVSAALTGGEMDTSDVEAIQAFVDGAPSTPGAADLLAAFELGASSPSFQTI
ncbi:hypothetical protein Poly30_18760 [Planctomycetes bacterium Poly30]|uniref:DUF1800 domain-containing protein n=1 Tax=Saltatorellus ferox TaxID=2528018 RepID=A0A518EQJ7_9BACT|nr:hypothetical protein Poly30_18760 [Planctomycetes bacterium Poly30]